MDETVVEARGWSVRVGGRDYPKSGVSGLTLWGPRRTSTPLLPTRVDPRKRWSGQLVVRAGPVGFFRPSTKKYFFFHLCLL